MDTPAGEAAEVAEALEEAAAKLSEKRNWSHIAFKSMHARLFGI